jgi:hypothetical protein
MPTASSEHRTFDRLPHFDERSRAYGIRALVPETPRSKTWFFGGAPWRSGQNLDQGTEGACVGFGWTQELIASPFAKKYHTQEDGNAAAFALYKEAKKVDEWPGEDYEGSSVLAGAKVLASRGLIPEYRWAFSVEDLVLAVGHHGPAVVGTDWLEGMDTWDRNGVIRATGNVRGGHCYLIRGVLLNPSFIREPVFRITNSWGDSWAKRGDCFIPVADFAKLLKSGGEACIPVRRS